MAVYDITTLKTRIGELFTPGVKKFNGTEDEQSRIDMVDSLAALVPNESTGTSYLNNPVPLKYGINIKAFGNSITEGSASSPFSNSYIALLNSYVGGTLTNLGVSGYTSKQGLADINQDGELPTSRTNLATWMLGVNDIIFSTSPTAKAANTDAAIQFLCNAFAKTITNSTSGTETGSWSNWGFGIANGGRTTGRLTSTAGNQVTFSIGSSSKQIFVCLFANPVTDTENWATAVRIQYPGYDQTFNPNKSRNSFAHYTIVIDSHAYTAGGTLTITNVSGGKMVVDYVGDCKLPVNCYPALVYDTTYVSTYWYSKPGAGHAAGVNDAWFDECNESVRTSVAQNFGDFGYPVAVVRSNKYFDPETMTPDPNNTDGIHPNNTGHRNILRVTREAITMIPTVY